VHACTVLAALPPGAALPAAKLAEYHDVPAAYLAKHLQALARHGVVETVKGPRGGYRLARPATEITVLDVVEAIDGTDPAFRCTEIRRRGPAGGAPAAAYRTPCGINRAFLRADAAWRAELAATTLATLFLGALDDAPPGSTEKAASWLTDAMRAGTAGRTGGRAGTGAGSRARPGERA
jgi:Rrf2 family protein